MVPNYMVSYSRRFGFQTIFFVQIRTTIGVMFDENDINKTSQSRMSDTPNSNDMISNMHNLHFS